MLLRLTVVVIVAAGLTGCTTQQAYPVAHAAVPEFVNSAVQGKYPGATAEHVQRVDEVGSIPARPIGYRGFVMREGRVIAEFRAAFNARGEPINFESRRRE